ncbi:nck-associated protein 5 isoform X3 [Stegostoma tigrinum]|nr:nck-associated protein 5 isoform X3 [Stegostoma tigrinum]XP_059503384.1 nck-associated protein 5 isoform X3 [Stegostoma tigrinum]XP_059503385.1 nck-associated protein 5 isoform X3 [Stegostoma tigrinum]XP_059503386.1 nck-associated protein 5 isoform X3 [Stegostoma tigrinum]
MDSNKYVQEVLKQLEESQKNVQKEKLAVSQLQRVIARSESQGTMCEKLMDELEEERCLRLETEKRLREVILESEISTSQMQALQEQFARMEETVRNLLQNQGALGQCSGSTADVLKACQGKLSEEAAACTETAADINATDQYSHSESSIVEQERTGHLLERLRTLEAENSALALENEHQREQYERCLDEVANQVVQALLTQKDLREECLKLRTRVFDLEQQNRALSVLFQQRVRLASDSLLQKLHSRIVDLSSGDLFSNAERNRSPIQSRITETQIHGALENIPTILKCQSQLNLPVPSQLYPRSSCSSSELSLSSACSEHSSGSFTWNEGKTCSKRSSLSWEKRLSIGSSLPSNLSSPAEELPPIREKESHILDGLKKLQKKKSSSESSSFASKWTYKDCMNSNEGIYSLGLKCHNRCKIKGQAHFRAANKDMYLEQSKIFGYDSDSHDDPDDDCAAIITTEAEVPNRDCKSFHNKLTHSVSDSLFSWDGSVKCVSERLTHTNSREMPEKLTSFVSSFQSSEKLCTNDKSPAKKLQFNLTKPQSKDLTIQLSDTEDIEMIDEVHLECKEEINSSDCVTSLLTDKRSVSHANLLSCKNTFFSSADKDEGHLSNCSDNRPKTLNLLKENCQSNKSVKTSSAECLSIVFDAEDGQPIKFNSQQIASVTVSSNEASSPIVLDGNHQQSIFAKEAALMPQGLMGCQEGSDARNYTVLESLQGHAEQKQLEDPDVNKTILSSSVHTDSVNSDRPLTPDIFQQEKLLKPTFNAAYKSNCVSSLQTYSTQKPRLSKIPSRGKSSPQKASKLNSTDISNTFSTSPSLILDKSQSLSNAKLSKHLKMPSITISHCLKDGSDNPKYNPQLPQNSKVTFHSETEKSHTNMVEGSLSSRRQMTDHGEHPTRDKCDHLKQEEINSPSPPPPPGRSTSLLFRPNCERSLNIMTKTEVPIPVDTNNDTLASLNTHRITSSVSTCVQLTKEVQSQQTQKVPEVADVCSSHHDRNSVQQSQESNGGIKDLTMDCFEKPYPKANCSNTSPSVNIQPCPQSTGKAIRSLTCIHANQKHPSPQNTFTANAGQSCESKLMLQCKPSSVLSTSWQCDASGINEPTSQPLPSGLSSPCPTNIYYSDDKNLKTRIPVGLKGFLKSPPLLRKSLTVPGKHEKDTINIYSKGNVIPVKSRQADISKNTKSLEQRDSLVDFKKSGDLQDDLIVKIGFPTDFEDKMKPDRSIADGNDADSIEIKAFKRSVSANSKPNLKPALGMNGAKARSQSFSNQTGEKPFVSMVDGPGKVRTQIITNTTERGNSLTRQNSTGATEAMQTNPANSSSATQSPSHSPRIGDFSYSRQVSYGSVNSSSSHHSSPSKLPCRTPPKGDSHLSSFKCDGSQSPPQKEVQSLPLGDKSSEKKSKPMPQKGKTGHEHQSSPHKSPLEHMSKSQSPPKVNMVKVIKKQENLSKKPETSDKVAISTPASGTQCSIEAKVMLGIQQNMQKVHGQDKFQVAEIKQKTGPSIAKWFGFRKSKLPAPNNKKSDVTKSKDEKKEAKNGSEMKQTKLDKRKDKRKSDKTCEDNQVVKKDTNFTKKLDCAAPNTSCEIEMHETHNSRKSSFASKHRGYKDHDVPIKDSTNDQFMKELLHRVDKKAVHQKENGSNHVSCRNMSKGNSHGSVFPSNSISAEANLGMNFKMKPATEIQCEIHQESLIDSDGEGDTNLCENYVELWQLSDPSSGNPSNWQDLSYENQGNLKIMTVAERRNIDPDNVKEAITESAGQDQIIGSSCQMRTLDSGIGTFPLPDSTNRATGRHVPKTKSYLECDISLSLQEAHHLINASQKAKTLEREVPCRAEYSNPGPDMIGHSTSDPTVSAKAVQAFQSCLPKPSPAGFLQPKYKVQDDVNQHCLPAQLPNICKSEHSNLPERMKDFQQPGSSQVLGTQWQAMHLCSQSSSSSDNETEAEFRIDETGTERKELFNKMKNSKHGNQQHHIDNYPCFGTASTVISFCQQNLYMHCGKEMQQFVVKQLHSDLSNNGKLGAIPNNAKQVKKEEPSSKLSSLPTVSLDTLNRINSTRPHITGEEKDCPTEPEAEKESVGKEEDPSTRLPGKNSVDNLESLSDSLYDSFSSCASQASNEV